MAEPALLAAVPLPTRCVVRPLTQRHALTGYALLAFQAPGRRAELAVCRVRDARDESWVTLLVRVDYRAGEAGAAGKADFAVKAVYPAGELPPEFYPGILERVAAVLQTDPASAMSKECTASPTAPSAGVSECAFVRDYRVSFACVSAPVDHRWLVTGVAPLCAFGPEFEATLCRVLDATTDHTHTALVVLGRAAEAAPPEAAPPAGAAPPTTSMSAAEEAPATPATPAPETPRGRKAGKDKGKAVKQKKARQPSSASLSDALHAAAPQPAHVLVPWVARGGPDDAGAREDLVAALVQGLPRALAPPGPAPAPGPGAGAP